MGSFKVNAGAIVRPLGHPTDMVPTKPGEVQPIGSLVIKDALGYYKLAPTGATSGDFGVVTLTNLNGKYDGQREVIFGHGVEVWVNVVANGTIVPDKEVIFSAGTAGRVDQAAGDGTDAGTLKVCGKMKHKASEWWKDGITQTYTNAAAADVVTIVLYQATR